MTHKASYVTIAKQNKKNKNVKDAGMACQKVCREGRDVIKVKVKLQSPILASFSHLFLYFFDVNHSHSQTFQSVTTTSELETGINILVVIPGM